jgi:DNA-binding NtrC family response regulator
MRELREQVERAAKTDCAVLLLGETGTGKGEVARAIHEESARSGDRLVHVDCAALSPSLIESELFGHERGAFTNAATRRIGRFEAAAAGTLFLDEIGELAPPLQAKLLRVLHDRVYERVGGSVSLPMRARVVAATNRSLAQEVAAGRFRSDLYYRLAVLELELPPLRERLEDLPALIGALRRQIGRRSGCLIGVPTPAAQAELARHPWPGNVRELLNLLERVGIYWPEQVFGREVALMGLGKTGATVATHAPRDSQSPSALGRALADCRGNVSQAARTLGVPRSTLRYRLARWGASPLQSGRVSSSGGNENAPRQLSLPLLEGAGLFPAEGAGVR